MKIGLALDDTLDTPDGVQQYVLQVGGWMAAQGHEVHYLVGNSARTDIANVHSLSRNLHVKFNGNRMSVPLPTNKRKLRSFLAEQKFDILHVQVPYSPFLAGRIIKAAPDDVAVIGTFHILPYTKLVTMANRVLAVLNAWSGRRFDAMTAVSPPSQKFAKQIYGYEAEVIPNPLRLKQFEGVENDSPVLNIVFLGRLVARKGVLQLLQAVAYMHEHQLFDGHYHVYIGGKGELLSNLQRFVENRKLAEIVTFKGYVDEAAKPGFLAQADIAVYPSLGGESFGIVLLEGMAAARGVVLAGNNPGYASVMQPYAEQLFNPLDTEAFAKKLAWYLAHSADREQASKLQHHYVTQFDIEVVGQRLLGVYTKALQARRKS